MKKLGLVLSVLVFMCSCGGSQGTVPTQISISLDPAGPTAIDRGQTLNFTATVANDASNQGVTWRIDGEACGGNTGLELRNVTLTTVTYQSPVTGSGSAHGTMVASSVANPDQEGYSEIVLTSAPSITTTSLPNGTVGTAYSMTLQASDGAGALTWSVATGSSLPAGLSLSSAGTISGTPTAAGPSTFKVKVTDSSRANEGPLSATQSLTLTVNPAPLSIKTRFLPHGLVATTYNATLQASGGTPPYTWSAAGVASLPSWLSLSGSGLLSGTATTATTSTVNVTVTDSSTPTPLTKTHSLSLTVNGAGAACTSSGNESVLSGQYAFSLSGFNETGFLTIVGSLTADGTGKITAGEADTNGVLGAQEGSINTAASSYSVGSDNRGCATIATPFGTFTTRFALGSVSSNIATRGRIIEWENANSSAYIATGQIVQQTPGSFSSGLSGSYAFSVVGWDSSVPGRLGCVGVMNASGGALSNLEEDCNSAGTTFAATAGTGTYASIDTNGRGTATFSVGGNTSHITLYRVSSSQLMLITSDSSPAASGEVQQQTAPAGGWGPSSLNGKAVFYLSGFDSSVPGAEVSIGIARVTTSGSLTATIYDNDAGTWQAPQSTSCTYSVASNGRLTLSGSNCGNHPPVFYLTAANTGFMLGTNPGVATGQLEPQVAGTFSNALVSGTFSLGPDALVSQSTETEVGSVTLDGLGNVNGTTDDTSTSSQDPDRPFIDTYTVNSDGTFSVGSSGTATVGIVISNRKFALIDHESSAYPSIVVIQK